ncbi:MAG: tetratricopeptide repeat protein [Burkholderiaceae bacterium]|nr:tetratricopeptide repeat protein [Burkholderiaceae bacterium]
MRLIAEIGFLGTDTGSHVAARALFKSLQVLRPDSTLPFIGRAMAELADDRAEEAARILRDEGLKLSPTDPEVKTFLGLALHAAGKDAEARKVLASVIAQDPSSTEPYIRMAVKLLATSPATAPPDSLLPRWNKPAVATGKAE